MDLLSPFTMGNFVKFVNFSCMLESKSDVIKDVSSAKLYDLLVAVKVLMKHAFFAFSPFLYVLMGSKGCFLF